MPVVNAAEPAEECSEWLAKLDSLQGKVDAYTAMRRLWLSALLEHRFCFGDKVRTWEKSRALIHLRDETFVRLDQNSTLGFTQSESGRGDWLDLIKGMVYFISRVPYQLNIKTPFVNATIKGTEFALRVTDDETQIDVFEGEVVAENEHGKVSVTKHQSALVRRGEAPVLRLDLKPEDAVQWTLYYPSILDLEPRNYGSHPAIASSIKAFRSGANDQALNALEEIPLEAQNGRTALLKAGILLNLGRVEEARAELQTSGGTVTSASVALALRSVIALVGNDKQQALDLAQQAVAKDPQAATGYRARSFVWQAHFELDKALADAEKTVVLNPRDANDWARLSELHLMSGQTDKANLAADQAMALEPNNPRLKTAQGFALLSRKQRDEARALFEQAIAADSSAPLPRFGLGLAKINQGDLDGGTEDITIAAALDPRNSLIRSYLGKAYYEQKRNRFAETQYGLAKQFDPKDPTPYFYNAIKKQTENQPVEALQDMQKAIGLNGNRLIYRSKQLLDDDLAARSAAVGRIYSDIGFGQRALLEGWRSIATDPSDYSAHRFVADSYIALPRHELARASELLQSQMLQPLNVTPIQPHLGESRLLSLNSFGQATASFNEFNPLYNRDRIAAQLSGVVGTQSTYGDELTISGVAKQLSYSFGQMHYQTNGYRPYNDLEYNIYNAFVQFEISPQFSLQTELRHRDAEFGDLRSLFNLLDYRAFTYNRHSLKTDSLRVGGRYSPSEKSSFIFSSSLLDDNDLVNGNDVVPGNRVPAHSRGFLADGQYIFKTNDYKLITGGSFYDLDKRRNELVTFYTNVQHSTGYIYSQIRFPEQITWTLGGSVDHLNDELSGHITKFNPKLGVMWQIEPDTVLRAAAFQYLKRSVRTDATIEPTQVAGFNQMYDDFNGTLSKRFGFALDHKFSDTIFSGIEFSGRYLDIPRADYSLINQQDYTRADVIRAYQSSFAKRNVYHTREDLYRAYLNWAVSPEIAVNVSYSFENYKNLQNLERPVTKDTITHTAALAVKYFHPSGFFSSINTSFVNQHVYRLSKRSSNKDDISPESQFVLTDFTFGYRFPKRFGVVSLDIKNIFDQRFNYFGYSDRTSQQDQDASSYMPERAVYGRFTIAF